MRRVAVALGAAALALSACTAADDSRSAGSGAATDRGDTSATPSEPAASTAPSISTRSSATPTERPQGPAGFDVKAAMRDVRALAAGGPREATSGAYERAAAYVHERFRDLGYDVRRVRFGVPAGNSWGVPVDAGRTSNVVATPRGLGPRAPYVLVGAHLDTVPQSPGAEDNASGVAAVLELARLAANRPDALRHPAVFVAFGAEEPRGPTDDEHHFGSLHHVDRMGPAQRSALRAMVSLDRVGAGRVVPVCTGELGTTRVRRALLATAERAGIPAGTCENRTSDHWPFEKAGLPSARLGGNELDGYHTPRDRPRLVRPEMVARTGRLLWAWLTGP